jgi:hypothetical protein
MLGLISMTPSKTTPSKAALALGEASRANWARRNDPERQNASKQPLPPGFVLVQPEKGKQKPRVELRIVRSPVRPQPNEP